MSRGGASRRTVLGAAASALCASAAGCSAQRFGADPLRLVALDQLTLVADGLDRPEGVVATRDGRVIVSCASAACTIISPDGARRSVGSAAHANGLAMDRRGDIIVANYGLLNNVSGGLQRVDLTTGATTTLADAIDGRPLTSSNFPAIGPDGDIYCSHTQWEDPRNIGAVNPAGFVYRVRADGRVENVVSGLRMANGICFSGDFEYLFVAQTAAANVLRYSRTADGLYDHPGNGGLDSAMRLITSPPLKYSPCQIWREAVWVMSMAWRSTSLAICGRRNRSPIV